MSVSGAPTEEALSAGRGLRVGTARAAAPELSHLAGADPHLHAVRVRRDRGDRDVDVGDRDRRDPRARLGGAAELLRLLAGARPRTAGRAQLGLLADGALGVGALAYRCRTARAALPTPLRDGRVHD